MSLRFKNDEDVHDDNCFGLDTPDSRELREINNLDDVVGEQDQQDQASNQAENQTQAEETENQEQNQEELRVSVEKECRKYNLRPTRTRGYMYRLPWFQSSQD
jgi:hypothetical protein